ILYMGPDLVTGLKNYLFYPDNILCILEDGEMISEKELDKLVKQDMERLEVLAVGKVTKKNRRSKKQNK
ncbi:1554_t:CDS:1, partial [Ambispora gerdemannii]